MAANLLEEFASMARAHAATVRSSIEMGRQAERRAFAPVREAAQAVIAARDLQPDAPIHTPLMAAIENLRKVLA